MRFEGGGRSRPRESREEERSPMPDLIDAFQAQIARDLNAFADRGTEPGFEVDGNVIRAAWQVQGHEREALFALKPGGRLRWASGPSGDAPYYAFLASDDMAGFRQLATACLATIKREPKFVASHATFEGPVDSATTLLTPAAVAQLINDARIQAEGFSTQLFFLKGDAGAGKTTLLREATILQAGRYLAGESDFLCLYVPAQGRELSNLRDAFAGELGELRAAFTHDAIAALAREGILVPVIDGFDELLGSAGYGGAFSSLQTFLSELDGFGTLVVSARSAFYDIEFGRSGARRTDVAMRITTAEVRPWSDEQLKDYLGSDREGRDASLTFAALDRLPVSDRELLRRPFFASQFEEFVSKTDGHAEVDLLEHLIDAYIEREAGKILDTKDAPVLTPDGHRYLFELAVSEMWENEVRQLSESDLRAIGELTAEAFELDAGQTAQLTSKLTSYAGFRPRRGVHASSATFAFEHEVYFDHFLGCAIGRMLRDSRLEELVRFLDRGVISEAVAAAAVKALPDGQGLPASLLSCSAGVNFDNRRRNLGSIALAHARDVQPLSDTIVRGLSFVDVVAGKALFLRVQLEGCQFLNVDLSEAALEDCAAHSSDFDGITLSATSVLACEGLRPGANVRRVHHDPQGDVYAPAEIAALLERLGARIEAPTAPCPSYSEHAEELIGLLRRLPRVFQRTTHLYEADEHRHQALLGSPYWPELRDLLIKHSVLDREMREAKGANVPAYRLRANIDELLADQRGQGDPQSSTAGLWAELRSL
jgi:hypothetical protein